MTAVWGSVELMGWENNFSRVRPYLLDSKAREGPVGKQAVGSHNEYP